MGKTEIRLFYVRVCHPNADSYREMTPQQIYKQHKTEKKWQIFISGNGDRDWYIYATCIYHNRRNVADIIADWLNLYRPRKESLTQQQHRG